MSPESERNRLQKVLLHSGEAELHQRLFEKEPIRALESFLECYDSNGVQAYEVPAHVLDFLHNRFQAFMNGDHDSLDKTFGGGTKRQRNKIKREENDEIALWEFTSALNEAKKLTPKERSSSTPFEIAIAETAEKYGISEDAMRDLYKRTRNQ